MYRCNCCNKLFEQPNEVVEKGETYDEPFGYGSHAEPDRLVAKCPHCKSEDFERAIFDGCTCPQCGKEIDEKLIDYTRGIDYEEYYYACPECKYELYVIDGKWVEE